MIICFILAILLVLYLARSVTKPILLLTHGAEAISKGNLDYRIKIETGDEIEELTNSFNQMTRDLKKSRKELKEYNKELEKKVNERTKALGNRVKELERFHNLTVGRELKMMELKEKIKELAGQPKK